jgi:hypothetical protein
VDNLMGTKVIGYSWDKGVGWIYLKPGGVMGFV